LEPRSKVTLRPRSRLEQVLTRLEPRYGVPPRPRIDALTQLTLLYLVGGGAEAKRALGALAPLCNKLGAVDADKLAEVPRELVAEACVDASADGVVAALRVVGALARKLPEGFDTHCRRELAEARAMLSSLPRLSEHHADLLLLYSGAHALVAPSSFALQVAVRLGYPGASYAAIARSLDVEVPSSDALGFAWRAHHLLDQHGKQLCTRYAPACATCPVRQSCAASSGDEDPAERLAPMK
jgi:endonuclease III